MCVGIAQGGVIGDSPTVSEPATDRVTVLRTIDRSRPDSAFVGCDNTFSLVDDVTEDSTDE